MDKCIHIRGEFITNTQQEEQLEKILQIRDAYGEKAFEETGVGVFTFKPEICGEDPIRDGINNPLDQLLEISKSEDFEIDGRIAILSEEPGEKGKAYENYTVTFENGAYLYTRPEIAGAKTETLVEELRKRGLFVAGAGEQSWIVSTVSSGSCDQAKTEVVVGTEGQVRKYLYSLAKLNRFGPEARRSGTKSAADVKMESDGSLFACVRYPGGGSTYNTFYRAMPVGSPRMLSGKEPGSKKKKWVTSTFNSQDESSAIMRVYGSEDQLKKYMAGIIRENRDGDSYHFVDGDTAAKDVCDGGNGYLDATAHFTDYHVTISAVPERALLIL